MTSEEREALSRVLATLNLWYANEARRGSNAKANAYADAARLIERMLGR